MRKACIYILLPFILLNGSVLELCKLPAFFTHFVSHQKKDKVDLLRFISMHYLGNDLNDNDDAEDMKLPFKKANINGFLNFNITLTKTTTIAKQHYFPILTHGLTYYNFLIDDPALDDLFKPPCS